MSAASVITAADWVGAAFLATGAGAILVLGGFDTPRQSARTALASVTAMLAAAFYAFPALGIPALHLGFAAVEAHYVLWLAASPLVLAALMVTATPAGRSLLPMALTAIFIDVAMVLALAVAGGVSGGAAVVWFVAAAVLLGLLAAVLWGPVRSFAHDGHPVRAALYDRHAGILTVLWGLWFLAVLSGPSGVGGIGPVAQEMVFILVDVAAFAAFGLLVALEDEKLVPLEEGAEAEHMAERAAAEAPYPLRPAALTGEAAEAERLIALHYRRVAEREAKRRARRVNAASPRKPAPAATRAAAKREERPRRHPRKRPGLVTALTATPFGPLKREDALPVALVAGVLMVVAHADKIGGPRR
ncbi:rhodopsin [Stappia sp. 22II-S9-Z10]|nr:rhodopsin [Stappia sp. 22II-S9-Z10]